MNFMGNWVRFWTVCMWLGVGCVGLGAAELDELDESVNWTVENPVDQNFTETPQRTVTRSSPQAKGYRSIHQIQQEQYDALELTTEAEFDALAGRESLAPLRAAKEAGALRKRVVGWHPYWMGTSYQNYDYSKLDTLAYFSYEVNPTNGSYNTLRSWDTTPAIAWAQSRGTKVVLTATLFGSANVQTLLTNSSSTANLINSLVNVVSNRNGDGVNIDFESVGGASQTYLTTFMSNLTERFHRDIPGSEVSIALPAVDWGNAFDVAAYDGFLDYALIMGYDYHWKTSEDAGPVAPLSSSTQWGAYCVEKSIDDYLAAGISAEKLLLASPYYGYDWPTASATPGAATLGGGDSQTYAETFTNAPVRGRQWDADGFVPYFVYTNASVVHQCWYDDEESLGLKYDMVNAKGIGGIGIWALGYDGGRTELWELIGEKFTLEGQAWTEQVSGTAESLYGAGASGESYAVVGAGGLIRTSADGIDWTAQTSGVADLLLNVCGASGTWVAVGDTGRILTSPDGESWTSQTTPTSHMLRGIAYGNGVHVAVGASGTILRSPDGTTWSAQTSGTAVTLQGVLYADGLFVAVGEGGVLLTSADGLTWTARTSNAPSWLLDAAHGNGVYVSVGLGSGIVTSPDGITWTRQSNNLPAASVNLYRVAYGDGQFAAVGQDGVIWGSTDGETWVAEISSTTTFLRGLVYSNGQFVAVGYNGTVLTKGTGPSAPPDDAPLEETAARQPEGGLSDIIVYTSGGHGAIGDTGSWIFGRPLVNGVVEDIGNIDQLNYFADYCFKAGATVVPMRPLGHQTNEVVLDNTDAASVTFGGSWNDSSSPVFYGEAGATPYRYAYINETGTTAWAIYRPDIPAAGFYPVYAWTRSGSDRVKQLYRVYHSGGVTDVRVNHRRVGLGWVWLGTYYFEAGTNGSVNISNHAPGGYLSTDVVIADAIRFGNGMGDIDRGSGVSKLPRELEGSRYWVQAMTGQGMSSTLYDLGGYSDNSDNVGAPNRMAVEMNREADGGFFDRVYLGFHSNAGSGAGRGPMGLYDTRYGSGTVAQNRQKDYATMLANELASDLAYGDNGVWFPDGYANNSGNLYGSMYGEIYGAISSEMNSTIIEVAFHDNADDANLLKCPSARRVMAMSSYQAIVKHLTTNNPAVVSPVLLPDPPTHVGAVNDGVGTVTIRWRAPVPNGASGDAATGFVVYRSTNGLGFGNPVEVSGGTSSNLTLTGMPEGRIYYFQVCATNTGGESLPSETVGIRVSPSGFAPHLVVNGFDRNEQRMAPTQYVANNINGNVTRVIQRRINSHDYVIQHGEAIAAAGRYFDSCANEAVEDGDTDLENYYAAYWILGRESTADETFSSLEQTAVSNFLSGGGNLFVSGTELVWDLARSATTSDRLFASNVLHTGYAADDAGAGTVTARTGGVFDGLGTFAFDYAGTGTSYRASSPDEFKAPSSVTALVYGASSGGTQVAGVAYSNGYRLVTLGFPFETIFSETTRESLLANTLDFFGDAPSDAPVVDITTANQTLPAGTEYIWVEGTNNAAVAGSLSWTNTLTGGRGSVATGSTWSIAVSLTTGVNTITVRGTNYLRTATASDTVDIEVAAGSGPVPGTILDEPFDEAPLEPAGWTFGGVDSYSSAASSGRDSPAVKFGSDGEYIVSPTFSGGINLQFWIKANPSSGTNSVGTLDVEQYIGGWSTLAVITNPVNVGTVHSLAIADTVAQLRFTWNKTSGNIALDDVIVNGSDSGPSPDVDSDGDGVDDYSESIAGTSPSDPNDVLAVETMVVNTNTGNLVLSWPSVTGRVYSIWRATNALGPYTQHVDNVAATAPINTCTIFAPTECGLYFYRLIVSWPDAP